MPLQPNLLPPHSTLKKNNATGIYKYKRSCVILYRNSKLAQDVIVDLTAH